MKADELLKSRRSVRRYRQDPVPVDKLREIADVARYAPSGGNRQHWEMILVHEPAMVDRVFPTLGWLAPIGAPPEGKRPTAYLVVISEGEPTAADCASLVTYVLLAAHARRVGTCWFGSVKRDQLAETLGIPEHYKIAFVVSLGYPDEQFEVYDSPETTGVTMEGGVVRVPKRLLGAILHENSF